MKKWTAILSQLVFGLVLLGTTTSAESNEQDVIDRAAIAINSLKRHETIGPSFKKILSDAKAVIIIPSLLKGGFIIGGEGGKGVMLARQADGSWSSPAFLIVGAGSIGFQLGGAISEVALAVMTDKGMDAVLKNRLKFGGDATAAIGPIGGSVEASTTTAGGADIFAYSTNKGLFAGGTLKGAVIHQREDWNQSYYGRNLTARQILSDPTLANPGATKLKEVLTE